MHQIGKGPKKFSNQAEKLHERREVGSKSVGKEAVRLVCIGFFQPAKHEKWKKVR